MKNILNLFHSFLKLIFEEKSQSSLKVAQSIMVIKLNILNIEEFCLSIKKNALIINIFIHLIYH